MARVLQVVTELVVGGATLSMLDIAEDLAGEHEVMIAHGSLGDRSNPAAVRARSGFPTYALPQLVRPLSPRQDSAAVRAFHSLYRVVQPDLVHTHSSKAGFVGRIGAPSGSGPLLHTVHGWGHTPLDGRLRTQLLINAERLCALRTTRLIAVSEDVLEEGLRLRIGRQAQYLVIGVPVDMSPRQAEFDAARTHARAALGLPQDAEVVGWVGRLSSQKDSRTLAEAIRRLLLARHNAYAALIGDGPDRGLIEHLLHAEIVERRVRIAGERGDVRALYPAFDVLVHTSLWEGHPRVVREALAARVPVVSARVSGTGDLAGDRRLGALVEPGNATAYVESLTEILDSDARRAPIDDSALVPLRAAADEPYRLTRELYRSVLAGGAR